VRLEVHGLLRRGEGRFVEAVLQRALREHLMQRRTTRVAGGGLAEHAMSDVCSFRLPLPVLIPKQLGVVFNNKCELSFGGNIKR
jgi:hypothetical protein